MEPEILHYLDSLIADESKHQRNAIVFRIGVNTKIKHMSDNVTDEFFELNLNDIKLLHADNIKKAREAEEGAQVSYAGTGHNFTTYLISRFLPMLN